MILGCTQNPAFLDFKNYNLIESEQFRLGCITGNDSNIFQDSDRNLIFAAQGRIDNPEALEPFLGSCTSGPDYIWKAFLFWGKNCPARLLGDWLFASYNTLSGELFLARDQNGKRELLYKEVAGGIMFSSNLRPLIKTSRQLNHLQVISLISGWNYPNSDQATIFQNILRLSPGHTLSYKSGRIRIEKYWFPEHIPLKHYSIPQDYSDELLEISKKAVACRIPSNLKVGSMLSGGLDSTTISSLAAEIIGDNPLYTFSHVPLYDRFYSSNPRKFYDETEHIKAVVESKTNIQSFLLNSANVSPIDGLERYVKNFNNFIPNGSNSFWVMDIYQQAVDMGLEVLLSGGFGNIALSYRGLADALPMNPGLRTLKRKVLKPLLRNFIEYRNFSNKLKNGFLNKNIIDKYNIKQDVLLNRRAGHRVFKTSQEEILSLMYKTYKSRLIENDSLLKIEKLDPTADIRIIEHCLAIPNQIFFNEKGERRQVIRRMMVGRLPDKVLDEQRKGRQAADIFLRFQAEIGRAEEYYQRFEKNPAFSYFIDTQKLKNSINLVKESKLTDDGILNKILQCLTLGIFLENNNLQ